MLGAHKKAVLQFSGGKDSLALLYLARPHLDNIEVHFGDTGELFPEIPEFVYRTCAKLGAKLVEVTPETNIHTYQDVFGLPSDIVPDWSTAAMAWLMRDKPKQRLQSSLTCCANMLWIPLDKAVKASGATLVLRGVKACDERRGVPPGYVDAAGVVYQFPLWKWSDADVVGYLEREGAAIPEHYQHVNDGLDCWICTAHTRTDYAKDRLVYLRDHRPELWPEVVRRVNIVRGVVDAEKRHVDEVFSVVEENGHGASA
jgi:3'-phosphoadenosine 5'-phosphosulfate sulfotransferase (PAPS reductase)/FAD synthetase